MSCEEGILLACDTLPENPWARDRLPAIRAALAGRRHEICDIYDFGSVEAAHHAHRVKGYGCFPARRLSRINRVFQERVRASGCKIVVLGTVDNYSLFLLPETVRSLRAEGYFLVGFLGDDEFNFDRNWPYVFLFDMVVAYVRPLVDRYNTLRPGCCLHLPNSCYFSEHDFDALQVPEEQKRHDVALFGSTFPARRRLVEELAAAGVSLSLFGGRGWLESPRLAPFYRGYVASGDFDRTVRESRIVLALLEDHLTGALHMNTKVWEAVRNGQMCVTSRYAPLVSDYGLVDGEDIVFYEGAEDLATKLRYYLAWPDERRRMAERLFRKIKARFDYIDLYRALFSSLDQIASRPREQLPPVVPARVTLLGAPSATDVAVGTPAWQFGLSAGWRRRVSAEFRTRVATSHVILADGNTRYDPSLSVWLAKGVRVSGVGRLRSAGSETAGDATLIWEKDTFEAVVLRGSWWARIRARTASLVLPSVWVAERSEKCCLSAWLGAVLTWLHRVALRRALLWRLAKLGL